VPIQIAIAFPWARRNYRTDRGDRKSALRFAAIVGCLFLSYNLLAAHYTGTRFDWKPFNYRLATGLWVGAVTWVLYMAIEPIARKLYPESLISWTRLLGGSFRDPLVGRDLLLGMLCGGSLYLLTTAGSWLDGRTDDRWLSLFGLGGFEGARFVLADVAISCYSGLNQSIMLMTLLVLLWALTRKRWVAWALLFALAQAVEFSHSVFLGCSSAGIRDYLVWRLSRVRLCRDQ